MIKRLRLSSRDLERTPAGKIHVHYSRVSLSGWSDVIPPNLTEMNNREERQAADKHTASQHKMALKHRHHPGQLHNSRAITVNGREREADYAMHREHSE